MRSEYGVSSAWGSAHVGPSSDPIHFIPENLIMKHPDTYVVVIDNVFGRKIIIIRDEWQPCTTLYRVQYPYI